MALCGWPCARRVPPSRLVLPEPRTAPSPGRTAAVEVAARSDCLRRRARHRPPTRRPQRRGAAAVAQLYLLLLLMMLLAMMMVMMVMLAVEAKVAEALRSLHPQLLPSASRRRSRRP